MSKLFHLHLIATIHARRPINDENLFNQWMQDLIELVDMKTFIPPVTKRCEEPPFNVGCSSHAMLSTSHACAHAFLGEGGGGTVSFDLYSCKHFSVEKVLSHFAVMEPTAIDYMIIDRNEGNRVVETSTRNYN